MRNALALGIAAAIAIGVAGCSGKSATAPGAKTLLVYCGGTMRQPMEVIAEAYEAKTGVRVKLSFGDSGETLIQAEKRLVGDGIVVHDPFSQLAEAKGLVTETRALATMTPVIGVKIGTKGEQEVKGLADLAKPGLKIGVPHPEYATAGNILAATLKKAGLADAVMKNAMLVSRASGDLVNALTLGSVDAVVAWDAVIRGRADKNGLKVIPIEEKYRVDAVTSATNKTYDVKAVRVTLSTLKSSKDPAAAKAFLDFAAGPDGRAAFAKFFFSPAP